MALRKWLSWRSVRGRGLEGRGVADPIARLFRRTAFVLALALAAVPARAEDLAGAVSGLAGDGFAAKEQAIVALGKLGDPRARPILQALSDHRLRPTQDGRVLLLGRAA